MNQSKISNDKYILSILEKYEILPNLSLKEMRAVTISAIHPGWHVGDSKITQ